MALAQGTEEGRGGAKEACSVMSWNDKTNENLTSNESTSTPTSYCIICKGQALVAQRVDNAIQRINHYPADKCAQNKLHYPLDSDLFGG